MIYELVKKHIEINPEVRFGKPVIRGTRLTVEDILLMLAEGMSKEEIIEEYPQLDEEKIRAALYFAAHKEKILALI